MYQNRLIKKNAKTKKPGSHLSRMYHQIAYKNPKHSYYEKQ